MLKNKKILLIILFALCLIFLVNSKCFASVTFEYEDNTYTVQDFNERFENGPGYNECAYFINDHVYLNTDYPNAVVLYTYRVDISNYSNCYISSADARYKLYYTDSDNITRNTDLIIGYRFNGTSWEFISGFFYAIKSSAPVSGLYSSNLNILDANNNIILPATPSEKLPEVATSQSDLENLDFQVISIDAWDYSNTDLYFLFYDRNYTNEDSLTNLYPVSEFLLNELSDYYMSELTANADVNKIYWIPADQLNTKFVAGGTYGYRFATRIMVGAVPSFDYITEEVQFTVNQNLASDVVASFNNNIKEQQDKQNFNNIENSINRQTQNQQNFYNNILSDTPDANIDTDINNSFSYNKQTGNLSSTYNGFVSRLMSLFSTIYDYNLTEDSVINIPLPHSNKYITLHSNIISSYIVDPLKSLITAFWMFVFYLYMYKFISYVFIEIEEGRILDEDSLSDAPGSLYASLF